MSSDLQRPVGVWRAVGEVKLRDLLWPEGLLAVAIGGGGTVLAIGSTTPTARGSEVGDVLVLAGALLAVVFTALAIVVSLPSSSYLRMLAKTPGGGMRHFLDPFLVAIGTQISLVLLSVAYGLLASAVSSVIEHLAFGAISVLFVFGVLDIAALGRQLVRHGIFRAADAVLDEADGQTEVTRLSERRP